MSSHSGELRILSVYGKGEGPLALDGHDTPFTVCKQEASSSLSADHSVVESLERGREGLVRREELTGQQQTPDTISIKVEEDIGGGTPSVEECNDFRVSSTQRGATSESLHADAPGSSHMSSHSGELRILSVYGKGEGPLALDGHDTPFTVCKQEASSSLSADHSVAESLERGREGLVRREELSKLSKGRPGVLFGPGFLNDIQTIHTGEKPYSCDQCMKRFQNKPNLKIHMRTHSGEKPYSCDQCMKRFSQSTYLKRHMRTHSGEKPYSCDQCMKRFDRSTYLKRHMRTHYGEKPHGCDQCMKRFQSKANLKTHMMSHSGEKPYSCDQCMKSFSRSTTLKIHMRTHSGEKPCVCPQCNASFSDPSNFRVHMLKQKGNGCLKSQMRNHSREKPYSCDQCMKRFSRSTTLKIHMRTHSGEKPCVCPQCNARFSDPSNLRVHMLKHTANGVL